jgi:signal transduction histidine kinase
VIHADVLRQVYWFGAAALTTVLLTSLYLIRSNRRLFAELAALSEARRDLAQQLITARESTLREIARELHDDLGQVLTALGSMVTRVRRQMGPSSPVDPELQEIGTVAQAALDNVRGLSQTLHPSILEGIGLEGTIEWYLSTLKRQAGLTLSYECTGPVRPVDGAVAIHVYRILQEALSNVARHSGANEAGVRLHFSPESLVLEVEDHGRGFDGRPASGLGVVTMRERAALIGGTIAFQRPSEAGTLVQLTVPLH